MNDAGLKLTRDKTGSIAVGIGAAIGGIGIEKHYIEESTTGKAIPIDALICKQSLEDAITTMKRPITQSVPKFLEKIKMAIRKRTEKGSKIIIHLCSFLDNEEVKKHETYLGKRLKRGLSKTSNKTIINADTFNGAYNIMRKHSQIPLRLTG